jgi:hypothetical protein
MSAATHSDWDGRFASALTRAGVREDDDAEAHEAFARDGFVILRNVLDPGEVEIQRGVFEANVLANDKWPFPREYGTRFAMVANDPSARQACLHPRLLASGMHMMQRRFYLAEVQGRDPLMNGGAQRLHRDWLAPNTPTSVISGFVFLDAFGLENGATRVIPGTHRSDDPIHRDDEQRAQVLQGKAGDVLMLDSHLIHAGSRNLSGATRRSLHFWYKAIELRRRDRETRDVTNIGAEERYLMGVE